MIVTPILARGSRSRLHSQGQLGFLSDKVIKQVEQVPVVGFWNQVNGSGYRSPEVQQCQPHGLLVLYFQVVKFAFVNAKGEIVGSLDEYVVKLPQTIPVFIEQSYFLLDQF